MTSMRGSENGGYRPAASRGGAGLVGGALAALLTAAACGSVPGAAGSAGATAVIAPTAATVALVLTGTGVTVELRHPVSWRLQRPGHAASAGQLGYLATFPLHPACRAALCPPGQLGPEPPGGVVVGVTVLPPGVVTVTRRELRSDDAGCRALDAQRGAQLLVPAHGGTTVVVGGCFRAPGLTGDEAAFAQLARSVRVRPAPPAHLAAVAQLSLPVPSG